jgi:hypothetical protein
VAYLPRCSRSSSATDAVVSALPAAPVKGTARRPVTMAAVRAVLLTGLMPEACYGEVLSALFGDLALLPWHVPFGSIDGSVTRMADTPGNRAAFGSAGTADDSAPYPHLRDLPVTDASTRGMLAIVTGPSGGDKTAPAAGFRMSPGPS